MMKSRKIKWWAKVLLILLAFLIIFSITPYLFSVTSEQVINTAPFSESVFFVTSGVSLHYRMWSPNGENYKGKVLLVHGLGGSTFCWRKNVDALLQAGYLVLIVDLPAFGYSDRKRGMDHSQENRSLLLWSLLDHLDGTLITEMKGDRWNLVGHSMGGGTVAQMAITNQDRTKSVIFVDGAVLTGGKPFGILIEYPPVHRWIEVLARKIFFNRDQFSKFLSSAYGIAPSDADIDGYLDPLLLDGTEGALADLMRSATLINENELKELSVPVYAIWGEQDTWVPLEEAYKIQTILPSVQIYVIPDAAHCPMETQSTAFNRALIEALNIIGG